MYSTVKEGQGPYEVMKSLPKVRKIDGDLRVELERDAKEGDTPADSSA
jgi:hypothetical protein